MSTQWNQQLKVFLIVIEYLKKLNSRMNTKHSKTNQLQKIEYKTNE